MFLTIRKYTTLHNLTCASALLLASLPVYASDFSELGKDIRVSGFGSIATTYTDSDKLGFRSNLTQDGDTHWNWKSDSLIGVQFDAPVSDYLSATVQLIGRDRVDNDLNSAVEWAYFTYQSSDSWIVRVGRVALDMTLVGDFAAVGYAYEPVRPPVEFYSQIAVYSYDGADITYHAYTDNGLVSVKLFGGYSDRDYKALHDNVSFSLAPIVGIATKYESDQIIARFSLSHSELDNFHSSDVNYVQSQLQLLSTIYPDDVAETLQQLELDNHSVDFYTAGLQYRNNDWKILGEVSYLDSDASLFLSYFSVYAGVIKRIDDYSLFGFYSYGHSTDDVYKVPDAVSAAQQVFDVVDSDQSTMSLGVRWDFTNKMALKFQWDRSWGEANKALLWDRATDDTAKQTVDVFTLSLNFIF